MLSIEAIIALIISNGFWISLLVLFLNWYEKFEKLVSLVSRAFSFMKKAERATVAWGIQAEIDGLRRSIESEAGDVLPYGIRIEWVQQTSPDAFIKGNQCIILLNHHRNQATNLVYAAVAYVAKSLLPHARQYLDPVILRSGDLTVTKKIVRDNKDALECFNSEIVEPAIASEPGLRNYCTIMEGLDDRGLFSRVMLRELHDLGESLYPKFGSKAVADETRSFVEAMERMASKERGIDAFPDFLGAQIRTSLVLLGRKGVIAQHGISPYLAWIKKCLENKVRTIYILASGENVEGAKVLSKWLINNEKVEKMSDQDYKIRFDDTVLPATCIGFRVKEEQAGDSKSTRVGTESVEHHTQSYGLVSDLLKTPASCLEDVLRHQHVLP